MLAAPGQVRERFAEASANVQTGVSIDTDRCLSLDEGFLSKYECSPGAKWTEGRLLHAATVYNDLLSL